MKLTELIELDKKFHQPTYNRFQLELVKGKGIYVWDGQGKKYIDGISGLGVMNLGHSNPEIIDTIKQQSEQLIHVTNLFYLESQLKLAEKLSERTFGGKCFFANSGAEANEGAIKLARKYAKLNYNSGKYKIVTAWNSFHGRTLAMLAATGQKKKQNDFEPLVPGFVHVEFNNIEEMAKAVDDDTCAILLEPIQGEGGVYPATTEYLEFARKISHEKNALLIFDEIQTGMGRTGTLFAFQGFGVKPDIITMAKGLGAGLPIGAFLVDNEFADTFRSGDHGSTFGGGPLVTSVALKVLELIDKDFLEKVQDVGNYFADKLKILSDKFPEYIKEVRIRGLMIGLEFKIPIAGQLVLQMLEEGLISNNIGANIIRFLPPLIIEKEQIDTIVSLLDTNISAMEV